MALVSGESSSLYDSENVGPLVSFNAFLTTALWPPYLVGGIFSATAMLLAPTKRTVIASGTLAIGLSLTAIDLSSGIPDGLAASVLCNFAAGGILATFTVILILDDRIGRHIANGNERVERIIWLLSPAAGYFTLAAVLFLALGFLTRMPTTPVSFRLEPSLNGYYVTKNEDHCQPNSQDESSKCDSSERAESDTFAILGKFSEAKGGRTKFLGGGPSLKIEWSTKIKSSTRGSVWVTQGCVAADSDYGKALKSTPIYSGDINNLTITADDGLSEFRITHPNSNKITVSDDNVAQFWMNPSRDDPEKIDISRFLGNGIINFDDNFSRTTFSLGLISLTGKKEGSPLKTRSATYSINGDQEKIIKFSMSPEMIEATAAISCDGLEVTQNDQHLAAITKVPYIGLLVSLEAPKQLSLEDVGKHNYVTVSGANGWIESTGYRRDQFHEAVTGGNLSQLSLIGVMGDLVVDGQNVSTGPTSTLQLSGKMFARTDGPAILVEGGADYLILNGKRLSSTRWERLDTGIRIPIILGVPTAAYFLLSFASGTLRRPTRMVWRLPRAPSKSKSKSRHRRRTGRFH
ncbi:hypothetical protein [Stenotrophomonas sp. S39]|uniref:hypothetical protein n=1 Tax=Stenotrophomonas sp. S39 TaxID=2767451 RepID=UPI00190B1211|nr:hypothetical protein [Stenotrophomonas sp. S39]MBK0054218.1 hypothetical protein [Stenotrophomonas sp. S39]